MRKRDYYLPYNDDERATWLNNFAAKLTHVAGKYNITPEEVMDMQNSALYFDAFVKYRNQSGAFQNSLTNHRNGISEGLSNGTALQPLQPPMMMLPPPVQPGIFKRAKALVTRIKAHLHYLDADGRDLDIIGSELTTDFLSIKPVFTIRLVGGGHPEIVWSRQGMTALEIQKRVGDEPWLLLALDTVPNYTDGSALPASGQSAVWQYRVMYHFKDERVGMWSDVVAVTVTG
jgi:hypothetical protein